MTTARDHTPTAPTPRTDRTRPHPDPVPIAVAAARLGITTEAVRMRLRRGSLHGVRRGRTWDVFLPDETPTARDHTPDSTDDRTPPPPTARDHTADSPLLAALHERVTALEAETARLWAELGRRGEELEREQAASAELRRLLAMQLTALPAPQDMPVAAPESPEKGPADGEAMQTSPRRRWAFWRR